MNWSNNIDELTNRIIDCAEKVHNVLGNGFAEAVYQRAFAIELAHHQISFRQEKEIELYFRGQHIGIRQSKFLVENLVMVEIKAEDQIQEKYKKHAVNHCETYHIEHGLLINFGSKSLDMEHVYGECSVYDNMQVV